MSEYKELVNRKRDEMLDTLLSCIEHNSQAWEKGWINLDSAIPFNAISNKSYNGVNALYLYLVGQKNGYADPRWVTFNQAKELGASIKKGEKGSDIFFWSKYDKATKKPYTDDTVKGMSEEETRQYLDENVCRVLKYYTVFNAEQCDKFPEYDLSARGMSDVERAKTNSKLDKIINNSAAQIFADGEDHAYYKLSTDTIHVPKWKAFNTMNDAYATILHEIAHSTGHPLRLNRNLSETFGSNEYAIEELRAELSSVFMQIEMGITLPGAQVANHGAYLKSWLEVVKNDHSIFYNAAKDAGKITDYIKTNYLDKVIDTTMETDADRMRQSGKTESELIAAGRARAQELVKQTGKPYVTINWSEYSAFGEVDKDVAFGVGKVLPLDEAEKLLTEANMNSKEREVYFKTKLDIDFINKDGKLDSYEACRYDIGSESGGLIKHIADCAKYGHSDKTSAEWRISDEEYNAIKDMLEIFQNILSQTEVEEKDTIVQSYAAPLGSTEIASAQAVAGSTEEPLNATGVSAVHKTGVETKRQIRLDNLEANVPGEMKEMSNWCAFNVFKNEAGEYKKKIWNCNSESKKWARSNDPSTWTTFEKAIKYARENQCDGLSFALTKESGIFCVDLDKCRVNGKYSPLAWGVYNAAKGTYTERSVSGSGLHVFGKKGADVDFSALGNKNADGTLEYYEDGRFMSMTGDLFMKSEKALKTFSASDKLLSATAEQLPVKTQISRSEMTFVNPESDSEVIERIRRSKKADEFNRLYSGEDICHDLSRSDMKLLNILGYFTNCDAEQMKRIFESSGLMRADKSRGYLDRTIEKVIGTIYNKPSNIKPAAVPPKNSGTGLG